MDTAASVAHYNYLTPSGYTYSNFDRLGTAIADLGSSLLTSGTLRLVAVALPGGVTISKIAFLSGATALSGGNDQWVTLLSSGRNQLAVSADATSGAWAANTVKSFTLAASVIIPSPGLYYAGLLVNATTPPSLVGLADFSNAAAQLSAAISGNSTTGLTNPASLPAQPSTPSGSNAGSKPYVLLG